MHNVAKNNINIILFIAIVMAMAILPIFMQSGYFLTILFSFFLYIILAQSWNIIGGYTGQMNIGFAIFFGLGAIITRIFWLNGIPFGVSFMAGGVIAAALGALVGAITFRLRGHYFSIATLAMAMIARITVANSMPRSSNLPPSLLANYSLVNCYYLALFVAVVIIILLYFLVNSRIGIGMKSVKENEEAARATGINTFKIKIIANIISTFFCGLAGGLFTFFYVTHYLYEPFNLVWSFEPTLIVFIGGAGTIGGPIIGSLFFVIVKEIFALTAGQAGVLIYGIAFIIVVLVMPGGLIQIFQRFKRPIVKAQGG